MKSHHALALTLSLLGCLRIAQAQKYLPDNGSFHEVAYSVWNTAYNATRTPAAVAQPRNAAQVSALVRCANQANLRLVVRGGGHSYEAMSLINAGLVIDLSRMLQLQLLASTLRLNSSSGTRRLLVGAGMRWGPVYAYLFQQHNMTMEGPTCPSVGVSGSTLGAWMCVAAALVGPRQCGIADTVHECVTLQNCRRPQSGADSFVAKTNTQFRFASAACCACLISTLIAYRRRHRPQHQAAWAAG